MANLNTDGIKKTTYNGIEIWQDEDGFFNVSKLVNHYQPNNKNTARYLKTKKFAEIFDSKALEYQRNLPPPNGGNAQTGGTVLKYKDVSIRMKDHSSDVKRSLRGLYLPRECLDVILMVLDPGYRAFVHEIMDTINKAYDGNNLKITVENSEGKRVEREITFDSAQWQGNMARSIAGDDEIEYWRMREQLRDSMW
jgi:hypothetical protein